MKYLISGLILFFAYSTLCSAQQKKRKNFTHDEHGNPSYYVVTSLSSTSRIELRVDSFTKAIAPFNYPPNQPLTNLVYLQGTQKIFLTTLLPTDSLSFYRYSLYENDNQAILTDAIPSQIEFIWPARSAHPGFVSVSLGSYPIENKKLTLKFYKITESSKISTVIFYNKPIQPAKILLTSLYRKSAASRSVEMSNLGQASSITLTEDLQGILLSIKNTDINFLYHVFLKNTISGKTIKLSNNWLYDFIEGNPYLLVDASYFGQRGSYQLEVVPVVSAGLNEKLLTQKSTLFTFTVNKELSFTQSEVALLLSAFILAAFVSITFVRARSHKKLTQEKQQKEIFQLQVSLVRAQLNPHFMFNALSSIQNLINKQDVENANRYLSKFARLTRHVLRNQELISLQEELDLLEDYLQMEKLRFGFHYSLFAEETLEVANLQIPAMLLQPFVENAVKHGVSSLGDRGEITIRLEKVKQDLYIFIRDNGGGYDTHSSPSGMGLNLSHKRISLLNQIYKDTSIVLQITSGQSGTEIKLSLIDWL
jgi:sensor histidine kinase YesM